jgi:hypothetical protein
MGPRDLDDVYYDRFPSSDRQPRACARLRSNYLVGLVMRSFEEQCVPRTAPCAVIARVAVVIADRGATSSTRGGGVGVGIASCRQQAAGDGREGRRVASRSPNLPSQRVRVGSIRMIGQTLVVDNAKAAAALRDTQVVISRRMERNNKDASCNPDFERRRLLVRFRSRCNASSTFTLDAVQTARSCKLKQCKTRRVNLRKHHRLATVD